MEHLGHRGRKLSEEVELESDEFGMRNARGRKAEAFAQVVVGSHWFRPARRPPAGHSGSTAWFVCGARGSRIPLGFRARSHSTDERKPRTGSTSAA